MAVRSEEEVIGLAAQMKMKIIKRGGNIETNLNRIVRSESGLARKLHHEVKETLERDTKHLQSLQHDDSVILACLRWVLGIKNDIDWGDLDLDK